MSTTHLSQEDIEHYRSQGYLSQVPVMDPDQARGYLARLEEIERAEVERRGGEWWPRDYRPWEQDSHPVWELAREIATLPQMLEAVSGILGPDILIRNADVFIKLPRLRRGIGWHQDTAEKGADADGLLTAWLGLTASNQSNGCLQFSAGSHLLDLPDGPTNKHNLTLKPTAVQALDSDATRFNVMDAGMMSMHHFRTVHRSGPNRTKERRVGFVVRYMSPSISTATAESGSAYLACGSDSYGHFALKDTFPMTWTM